MFKSNIEVFDVVQLTVYHIGYIPACYTLDHVPIKLQMGFVSW